MKFLSRLHARSKSKLDDQEDTTAFRPSAPPQSWKSPRRNQTARLSPELLKQILAFVCPHARDESYTPCDESMADDGCMLCDLRDLAQCSLVNRRWNETAQALLYCHIRIDAIHYCERAKESTTKRPSFRSKPFGGRNEEPLNPPQERLRLFSRTVRENGFLARQVCSLKMPYMTRESCQADVARAVSTLSNLRYIDLPEGFYTDAIAASPLKQELQGRCPEIRKMKYMDGAEASFAVLADGKQWRNLECLELNNLSIDSSTLVNTLASLSNLKSVDCSAISSLDDQSVESFPPLQRLDVRDAPNVTGSGIRSYLSHDIVSQTLNSLSLTNTGVIVPSLFQILGYASCLLHLSINDSISRPFPIDPPPPLRSKTLRTLHYEISASAPSSNSRRGPSSHAESYYAYLANSILAGALPALTRVFALSPSLPGLLRQEKSSSPSSFDQNHMTSVEYGGANLSDLTQSTKADALQSHRQAPNLRVDPLQVYTKSISELEWDLTVISFPLPHPNANPNIETPPSKATATRPVSLYQHAQLSPQYRNTGRESVMIRNGFGGFLMVPGEEGGGHLATGARTPAGSKTPKSPRFPIREKDPDSWMG